MAREEKAGKGNPLYRHYTYYMPSTESKRVAEDYFPRETHPRQASLKTACLLILAPEGGVTEFDNDIDSVAENLLTAVFLLLHLVSLRFLGLSRSLWASRDCGSLPKEGQSSAIQDYPTGLAYCIGLQASLDLWT